MSAADLPPSTPVDERRDDPLGIEQTCATLMALGNELLADGRMEQASAAFVAAGYIDADAKEHAANRAQPTVPSGRRVSERSTRVGRSPADLGAGYRYPWDDR